MRVKHSPNFNVPDFRHSVGLSAWSLCCGLDLGQDIFILSFCLPIQDFVKLSSNYMSLDYDS